MCRGGPLLKKAEKALDKMKSLMEMGFGQALRK
jgi:hypothetical protein